MEPGVERGEVGHPPGAWFGRLWDGIQDAAVNGELDQFESTDDVLRVRFIEWRRFRTALLRQGHRHRGIVSGLAGWATDLPLTAAMMRWAVSVRGDDLHDPASAAPAALRLADVIGLLS